MHANRTVLLWLRTQRYAVLVSNLYCQLSLAETDIYTSRSLHTRTISSVISAPYQESFQLSLSVLVCYRCRMLIFSLRGNSSPIFIFHFQGILLVRSILIVIKCQFTGLSPCFANLSRVINWHLTSKHTPAPYNARCYSGFRDGLFQFRSPLLLESLLISIPPLNDMLKFSG